MEEKGGKWKKLDFSGKEKGTLRPQIREEDGEKRTNRRKFPKEETNDKQWKPKYINWEPPNRTLMNKTGERSR